MESEKAEEVDSKKEIDTFEDILSLIKPLGVWQAATYGCMAYLMYFFSMSNVAVTFFQIQPDFACRVAAVNSEWTVYQTANISSPSVTNANGESHPNACKYYPVDYGSLVGENYTQAYKDVRRIVTNENISSTDCQAWIYDRETTMSETLVTQFDLVCDQRFLVEHSTFVYFAGVLLGSFISGYFSDRFGRKKLFLIGSMIGTVAGLLQGFTPNYILFLIVRFILAMAYFAKSMGSFCLAMEITNAKYRNWVGGLYFIPYALGYTTLPGAAYLIRDWRILHAACVLPTVVSVFFWWIVPESPRWLLINGRINQAKHELKRANKRNGGSLPDDFDYNALADAISNEEQRRKANEASIWQVFARENGKFKYPVMVTRAINIFFNWFVNSMVYYGIALNISSFAGNKFLNNFIAGIIEIPSYLICVPLLYWSRRYSLASMLFLAGASLFVVPWIPVDVLNWLRLFFVMMGKLAITASFALVYVYTPELYPTAIRNSGIATSSAISRIGSMGAPYISTGIMKVDDSLSWAPMVIFGAFSLAAGVLTLFLPETKGKKMPEHLEDIVSPQVVFAPSEHIEIYGITGRKNAENTNTAATNIE